jgi:hypothetical protein
MNRLIKLVSLTAILFGSIGAAYAQSSTTCAQRLDWAATGTNGYTMERIAANHPECVAGSSTTSAVSIGATAFTQATAITHALASRPSSGKQAGPIAMSGISGLAAGGQANAWNTWASYSDNASSVRVNNGANRVDNDTTNIVLGADYALSPVMTFGVSGAFDRGNGGNLGGATNASNGFMIAPYIGYQLSKELSLDASVGLGQGEFTSGAVRADADRWFATGNLSYSQWSGNIQLTGKASYMHGVEKFGDSKNNGANVAGSASTNKVDQVRIGGQAGYWMNGFMPYAGLSYAADIRRSSSLGGVDSLGRGAFVLDLGVNFFSLTSKMTGGIAYQQEHGRTNSKNETFMANINLRF